jgi:hypothetical protein
VLPRKEETSFIFKIVEEHTTLTRRFRPVLQYLLILINQGEIRPSQKRATRDMDDPARNQPIGERCCRYQRLLLRVDTSPFGPQSATRIYVPAERIPTEEEP